ncbi:hypothetical protein BDN72DRAFT_846005 [Pluteus cervinus]|uniref:Uncharacterized protein n=1 Tax=Pluteus cervinus TaxID=181527 RepID=A0ACD3AJU6_9AGAR|nr:hypothetical protein BDN72DRAFT_846005 [Pluteus cervinus]
MGASAPRRVLSKLDTDSAGHDASNATSAEDITSEAMDVDQSDAGDQEETIPGAVAKGNKEKDLQDDMNLALTGLDFNGDYAMAHAFPLAPNPWLTIEGLGLLRLPLGDDDATRIISASGQKKRGMNTWEISSDLVSFGNDAWNTFLQEEVLEGVKDGLGLTVDLTSLRCQLHKLRLYKADSRASTKQESTPTVEGVFATFIILLPSLHTGGDDHVSHSSGSQVLSLPPDSPLHTSIIAWYSDVSHSVAPILSGYRLGLCYDLIHTQTGPKSLPLTLPFATRAENLALMQRTLEEWRDGVHDEDYEDDNDDNHLLAFILDNHYPDDELDEGKSCLEGTDAHIVANLGPVAEQVGVTIFLANLKYTVEAQSESMMRTGYDRPAKRRKKNSGGDDDDASASESESDDGKVHEFAISNIVDLDGTSITKKTNYVEEYQIIPKDAFSGVKPDGYKHNEYMDIDDDPEDGGDCWYDRTVLIFVCKDRMRDFYLSNCGTTSAMSELKKLDPHALKKADVEFAERVVKHLPASATSTGPFAEMFKLALSWKNFRLWKTVWKKSTFSAISATLISQAVTTFGFERLSPLLEDQLTSQRSFSDRLKLIQSIADTCASKDDAAVAWRAAQKFKAIETMPYFRDSDIPIIIKIAETEGIKMTMASYMRSLKKAQVDSDFWISLIRAIQDRLKNCASGLHSTSGNLDDWQESILQCLEEAATAWATSHSRTHITSDTEQGDSTHPEHTIVSSSMEVLDLTVSLDRANLFSKILNVLLSLRGTTSDRFKVVYSHFIPKLQKLLAKHDSSVASPPFSDFARDVIGLYLQDILGPKVQVIPALKNALRCGPGCRDCNALESFMKSSQRTYRLFAGLKRRAHIERQIQKNGANALSFETQKKQGSKDDDPHDLVVTKKEGYGQISQWDDRQEQARKLLKLFGDSDVVAKVMGDREDDVLRALDGTRAFRLHPDCASGAGEGALPPAPIASTLSDATSNVSAPTIQAGNKRKRQA